MTRQLSALAIVGLLIATPALAEPLPAIADISAPEELAAALRDHGYPIVWNVQDHGSVWTGLAVHNGAKVDFMVDAETGEITSRRARENTRRT